VGAAVGPRSRREIRTAHPAARADAMAKDALLPEEHGALSDCGRIAGERIARRLRGRCGCLAPERDRQAAEECGGDCAAHSDVAHAHVTPPGSCCAAFVIRGRESTTRTTRGGDLQDPVPTKKSNRSRIRSSAVL